MGVTTVYVTHDQTEAMTMADHIVLMKDGEILQEGTPSEMYDHPRNLFVAGFLGTPQINTFDCAIRKGADKALCFETRDFSLPVPDNMAAEMKPLVDKDIILGIRPSDFTLAESGAQDVIRGAVDSVEPLGDANLVYLNLGSRVMIVKIGGSGHFSETLALRPDTTKLHVFDKETQKRLNG
jgi:multiple sugar transport system ATP-binding protein